MEKLRNLWYAPEWKRVTLGMSTGVVALVAVAGLTAAMLDREVIGMEAVRWCAVGALLLAGFLAVLSGGGKLNGALSAAGVAVVLIGLNIGLYDGQMEGMAASLLALIGGSGTALLLKGRGVHRKGAVRRRKIVKLPKNRRR